MNAFIEVISNSSFCKDMYVAGEEMDKIISSVKTGKSAGRDDIQAEHLLYAGGAVIDSLCKLMTAILVHGYRLQQPVQNPISDNTNVLWNSPSLGKNYSYRLPLV